MVLECSCTGQHPRAGEQKERDVSDFRAPQLHTPPHEDMGEVEAWWRFFTPSRPTTGFRAFCSWSQSAHPPRPHRKDHLWEHLWRQGQLFSAP